MSVVERTRAGGGGGEGEPGPPGPQGERGEFNFRGAWLIGTAYTKGDATTEGGNTYASIQNANVGNKPSSSPLFWTLIAEKGGIGPTGPTGEKGEKGTTGEKGEKGTTGETGPAGAPKTAKEPPLKITGSEITIAAEGITNEFVKKQSLEGNRLAKETLGNEEIQTNAINARTITAGAVTEEKLGSEAVSEGKIKGEAVTAGKIGSEAVTAAKIKAEAVETSKIKLLAVTAGTLAAEAVETAKIKLLAVTTGTLAGEAVTAAKIGSEAVETAKIKGEAVTEPKLASGAVTETKIGTGAVTEGKIGALAVTAAKIGAEAVETAKIKLLAVTTGTIAGEAVTAAKIASEAVEEAKIKAKAVSDGKLAEVYALLAGRAGGQELIGGTEELNDLVLKSNNKRANPATFTLTHLDVAAIKKGAELGILEVKQISGLTQLTVSGSIETTEGQLTAKSGLKTEGFLALGGEAPAEFTKNENSPEFKTAFVHLTSNKAVLFGGLTSPGANGVFWLYNANATFNITLIAETQEQKCTTVAEKKEVTVESSKEMIVGGGVSGTGIKAGTIISTIVSETEITISNAVKAGEGGTPKLTFTSPAAAAKRGNWSTGKGLIIEPKHTKLVYYDNTAAKWHDVG